MELLCVQKCLEWPFSWAVRERHGSFKTKKINKRRRRRCRRGGGREGPASGFDAQLCARNVNGGSVSQGGRTQTGTVRHNEAQVSAGRTLDATRGPFKAALHH